MLEYIRAEILLHTQSLNFAPMLKEPICLMHKLHTCFPYLVNSMYLPPSSLVQNPDPLRAGVVQSYVSALHT